MKRKEFEKIVREGIRAIPEKFLRKLSNVTIVIENGRSRNLLGLYEGVPQANRRAGYCAIPDKITIFQNAIEQAGRNHDEIKEIVKNTVWHEIAHHFGMDEPRVRRAESRRG